jgi:DHA1 family bicyclomycin/chloramphenicol resistance-like MFS transporter
LFAPRRPRPVSASIQHALYLAGAASFLGPASISIYTPSLVALRESFNTSNALAGATVSVFAIVLAASQLLYGPVIDRFSGKVALAGGLLVFGLASLLAAWTPHIGLFLVARGLQAAGVAAGLVVGGALVSDRFPPHRRAAAMGTLQSFNALGGSLGPVIGSTIIALGFVWQADFVALAVAGLLIATGVWWLLPRQAAPAERFSLGAILAVLRLPTTLTVALLGFAQYYGHVSLITFAPVLLREHAGLEPQWIGLLLLPQTLGVMFGATLGGRLADRWGRRRVALLGAGLTTTCYGAYTAIAALVPGAAAVPLLALAQAGFGLTMGMGVAAQLVLMVEWLPARRGTAVGTYAAVRYTGAALGPLIGGVLLDRLALWSPFAVGTLLLTAVALLAARLLQEPAAPVPSPGSPEQAILG